MATGGNAGQLTRRQIVRLAAAIAADNMESIAEGYLDLDSYREEYLARKSRESRGLQQGRYSLLVSQKSRGVLVLAEFCDFSLARQQTCRPHDKNYMILQ